MEFDRLTETCVENSLLNVRQIVFETTNSCNLQCYYCAYGALYQNNEERPEKQKMSFSQAKILLDYFATIWTGKNIPLHSRNIYISFYGGEPLVNFVLIEETVRYCESLSIPNIHFLYSMTTNAVLLDRHMDFLARYNFRLLISLDGNEHGQSYRVNKQGDNSFPIVIKSIERLQEAYPDYFREQVNFNAVIHDRNDLLGTYQYIKEKFGKEVTASSLNTSNIRPEKKKEFYKIYKQIDISLDEYLQQGKQFQDLSLTNFPLLHALTTHIFNNSGNVYKTYNDLLADQPSHRLPTGTCVPFSKKIFLTVNGEILVCERILQKYSVGKIENRTIHIDIPEITRRYNGYYRQIQRQCDTCYNKNNCTSCIFHLDSFMETGICPEWTDEKQYHQNRDVMKQTLLRYPGIYRKIMQEIVLSE